MVAEEQDGELAVGKDIRRVGAHFVEDKIQMGSYACTGQSLPI